MRDLAKDIEHFVAAITAFPVRMRLYRDFALEVTAAIGFDGVQVAAVLQ